MNRRSGDDSVRPPPGLLADRGQHRAPSISDLLIAATAEIARLTVLHLDKDFDLIAAITGQPIERLDV
jgi:predicted nucleic acid-binding protein